MTDVSWWKMRPLDGAWIRTLAKPAIGFVLSNLSTQSILLQGPRIALGIVSGGTAVALYNVYGIVLRLADQIVRLMSAPLEVEIAQAWHQGQRARAYRLIVVGTQLSVYSLVACGLALLLAGPSCSRSGQRDGSASIPAFLRCFSLSPCRLSWGGSVRKL
jgi:O-antigen/teichoic acid export membrane protein